MRERIFSEIIFAGNETLTSLCNPIACEEKFGVTRHSDINFARQ